MKHFRQLVWILVLICGYHIANAQQNNTQLAQQVFAIFEQHCMDCHSEFGSYSEELVIDHAELIKDQAVIPGNPNDSELYLRLLGDTDGGAQMPYDRHPLDDEPIATVRRWIEAGAPDWNAIPKPERHFITTDAIIEAIDTDLKSFTDFERPFARYFTLAHLYNAGVSDDNLRAYRSALSKLINSLSWGRRVVKPQQIDTEETIFRIDLRHYEWDSESDPWYKIQQAYPYGIDFKSSTYARLCRETNCKLPFVRADWFIANAALPPLYHEILELPQTDRELERELDVNVEENIKNAPGVRVWRAGFNESGVSSNNRIVERHESRYGAYWKSYDFAGNVGRQNIFTHPLSFTHDGGEIIFNLPNGLQAYYLANAVGDRLDKAPVNIVSNTARDPVIHNGLSCMGCHTEGMRTFEDQVRPAIEQISSPPYDRAQALRLYAEKAVMGSLVREDTDRYKRAVKGTGAIFGGTDPIQQLVKQFEGSLNVTHVAAEVGLETDDFIQKIGENISLQNAGLGVLLIRKGTVKRDAWESQFGTVVSALKLGKYVRPSRRLTTTVPPRTPPPRHIGEDGAEMVWIERGTFEMGSNNGHSDEKPIHTVTVNGFYMDAHEVTNAQYRKFIQATGHAEPIYWNDSKYNQPNQPVVGVTWYDAMAYCQWVGKRLPTEAEWEYAARGGLKGKKYPWGDEAPNAGGTYRANYDPGNYTEDGYRYTAPVKSFAKNGYGLYDMAGNVWEWCLDEYDGHFYGNSPSLNPVGGSQIPSDIIKEYKNNSVARVLRGGSWYFYDLRVASRSGDAPASSFYSFGFRCARALTP